VLVSDQMQLAAGRHKGEAAARRRSIALQRERTEGRQRHGAGGEQTWQRRCIAGRSYHIVAQRVMSCVSDDRVMSCVSDEKASTRRVAKGTKRASRIAGQSLGHRIDGLASSLGIPCVVVWANLGSMASTGHNPRWANHRAKFQ